MFCRSLCYLLSLVFLAAATWTTRSLTSNGDTAMILGQVAICVLLWCGVVYFKNHDPATD